ncbi:aldo/keto reductase [Candidatus Roizmanbacteria bacterium]|nr:aldo/keto reductase [Candidatus Roizmanbacteria bacterium]
MKIPTKILKSGFEIPVFGLGTWEMGGKYVRDFHNNDKADIKAIQNAIDMGITHIDSAEMYAAGHAEELVGLAIKKYEREKLLIASKISGENLRYLDVFKSLKASLRRLQIKYLDLYLIHWPSFDIPIKETMRAMDELVKNGLVKYIGVSNFGTSRLQEAQHYAKNKIVTNQVLYSLLARVPSEDGLLDYCQINDVLLTAYRPVEKGKLTKTSEPLLEEMCKKYDKTPPQIAINWLISQDNVVAISKMSNSLHLKENLGSLDWQMDKKDVGILKKKFPRDKELESDFPLR